MNLRKIKLALTVDLLNIQSKKDLLSSVIEKMNAFTKDVGDYLDLKMTRNRQFTEEFVRQTYSIKYEKCTLDIDLITNQSNCKQYIQTFDLQA